MSTYVIRNLYNSRPGADRERCSRVTLAEQTGIISAQQQVERFIRAGKNLKAMRQAGLYDFPRMPGRPSDAAIENVAPAVYAPTDMEAMDAVLAVEQRADDARASALAKKALAKKAQEEAERQKAQQGSTTAPPPPVGGS